MRFISEWIRQFEVWYQRRELIAQLEYARLERGICVAKNDIARADRLLEVIQMLQEELRALDD